MMSIRRYIHHHRRRVRIRIRRQSIFTVLKLMLNTMETLMPSARAFSPFDRILSLRQRCSDAPFLVKHFLLFVTPMFFHHFLRFNMQASRTGHRSHDAQTYASQHSTCRPSYCRALQLRVAPSLALFFFFTSFFIRPTYLEVSVSRKINYN